MPEDSGIDDGSQLFVPTCSSHVHIAKPGSFDDQLVRVIDPRGQGADDVVG